MGEQKDFQQGAASDEFGPLALSDFSLFPVGADFIPGVDFISGANFISGVDFISGAEFPFLPARNFFRGEKSKLKNLSSPNLVSPNLVSPSKSPESSQTFTNSQLSPQVQVQVISLQSIDKMDLSNNAAAAAIPTAPSSSFAASSFASSSSSSSFTSTTGTDG